MDGYLVMVLLVSYGIVILGLHVACARPWSAVVAFSGSLSLLIASMVWVSCWLVLR